MATWTHPGCDIAHRSQGAAHRCKFGPHSPSSPAAAAKLRQEQERAAKRAQREVQAAQRRAARAELRRQRRSLKEARRAERKAAVTQTQADGQSSRGSAGLAPVAVAEHDTAATLPPAAWHVDPQDPSQWRYWDGQRWTEHRAPRAAPQAMQIAVGSSNSDTVAEVVSMTPEDAAGPQALWQNLGTTRATTRVAKKSLPSVAETISQMQLAAPRHPLEEQIEVAGETYHVKGIKRVYAEAGIPVTSAGATIDEIQCVLVPEPWNPHDSNAVAVAIGTHHVGYIPADMAVDYSGPLLELAKQRQLITGQARIWALDDKGIVRARVTILVPEANALP